MKPDYLDSEIDSSIFLINTCMFFRQVKFLSILDGDITVAPGHKAWDTSEMMNSFRFGTAISCIDGRTQQVVIDHMKQNYNIDGVDMEVPIIL